MSASASGPGPGSASGSGLSSGPGAGSGSRSIFGSSSAEAGQQRPPSFGGNGGNVSCSQCGERRRSQFSANQLSKGPTRRCLACVAASAAGAGAGASRAQGGEAPRATPLSPRVGGAVFTYPGGAAAGDEPRTGYEERRDTVREPWPTQPQSSLAADAIYTDAVQSLVEKVNCEASRAQLMALSAEQLAQKRMLKEIYLPLGRFMELVTCDALTGGQPEIIQSDNRMGPEHLTTFTDLFDGLPDGLRRTGIDGTLHRISRTLNPITRECTAVAARVGRVIQGHVEAMLRPTQPAVLTGSKSVLIIGAPNVGKTTILREMARLLSEDRNARGQRQRIVAVVDKSLEIAGSGNVPHPSIGPCRVLQVDSPDNQHAAMIEAVENQSPDVIVVDEITNRRQTEAARTIAQRGVSIVATVHGSGLPSIINDPERRELLGGVTSGVLLSDASAAARADKRKAVEKRKGDPPFDVAIEVRGFHDWIVHDNVGKAVDAYLEGAATPAWRHRKVVGVADGRHTVTEQEGKEVAEPAPEPEVEAEDPQLIPIPPSPGGSEMNSDGDAEHPTVGGEYYYEDRQLEPPDWVKVTLMKIDNECEPPTYTVRLPCGTERNTERSRLRTEGETAVETGDEGHMQPWPNHEEELLEITPVVAFALTGDSAFEYTAVKKGEPLPPPAERERIVFDSGRPR